jgi:hypothetical protein
VDPAVAEDSPERGVEGTFEPSSVTTIEQPLRRTLVRSYRS